MNIKDMKKSNIGWVFAGVVGLGALVAGNDKDNNSATEQATEQESKETVIEERYVNTATLNVRDKPNGKILGKKERGDSVSIYEIKNGWSRIIDNGSDPQWVSIKSLCKGAGCYEVKTETKPQYFAQQETRNTKQAVSKSHSSSNKSYNSDCSCAVVDYCVGPRGGHYCINSKGNKTYKKR
ncbi:hypothetical protein F981_04014 [Acinetobacter guillouiae CIP 63.46]|nr:SH3 domain-containing protein [Acinetobacter guillouiae]ENU56879.1 hypothetical protein F981_04014 [Acinetobacter guillouiae CIP 63.46]